MRFTRTHIATGIAVLFHVCGCIGILFTPYKEWFIDNTPFTLFLSGALIVWCQPVKDRGFIIFGLSCFATGMIAEMIGVHTGKLFGNYTYGTVLGKKIYGVPWLIGWNWFIIIFCSGAAMHNFQQWLIRQTGNDPDFLTSRVRMFSFVADAALLATFFDWLMEPVAMKLGFWQWNNGYVPVYNYICWFLLSLFLLAAFPAKSLERPNHFAVHLFIIQFLFFLALRTQMSV